MPTGTGSLEAFIFPISAMPFMKIAMKKEGLLTAIRTARGITEKSRRKKTYDRQEGEGGSDQVRNEGEGKRDEAKREEVLSAR